MRPEIEVALQAHALNGETPVWSEREEVLYWVDIRAPRLHRFDPKTKIDRSWLMPAWIGCFALDGEGAVVTLRTGLFRFDFATGSLESLAAAPFDPRRFAFNDGRRDRRGRFLAGAMYDPLDPGDQNKGAGHTAPVWRYEGAGRWTGVTDPIQTSNGLAWSPDGKVMYHSDTETKRIWTYDYDEETGTPLNRRLFAEIEASGHHGPDGACVDRDGFYICAVYGEGCLMRFDPDGKLERRIEMPARFVTMPAFGGSDLSTLFVTSASWPVPLDERVRHPAEGTLFMLEAPVPGLRAATDSSPLLT